MTSSCYFEIVLTRHDRNNSKEVCLINKISTESSKNKFYRYEVSSSGVILPRTVPVMTISEWSLLTWPEYQKILNQSKIERILKNLEISIWVGLYRIKFYGITGSRSWYIICNGRHREINKIENYLLLIIYIRFHVLLSSVEKLSAGRLWSLRALFVGIKNK